MEILRCESKQQWPLEVKYPAGNLRWKKRSLLSLAGCMLAALGCGAMIVPDKQQLIVPTPTPDPVSTPLPGGFYPEPICQPTPQLTTKDRNSYINESRQIDQILSASLQPAIKDKLESLPLKTIFYVARGLFSPRIVSDDQFDIYLCKAFGNIRKIERLTNGEKYTYHFKNLAFMLEDDYLVAKYGRLASGDIYVQVEYEKDSQKAGVLKLSKQRVDVRVNALGDIPNDELNRLIDSWFNTPENGIRSESEYPVLQSIQPNKAVPVTQKDTKIVDGNKTYYLGANGLGWVSFGEVFP